MSKTGSARKGGLAKSLSISPRLVLKHRNPPVLRRVASRGAEMGSFVFKGQISVTSELARLRYDAAAWKKLLRYYLRRLGMPQASLGVILCGDARSRALNRAWRRQDKPTDVLSFPLNEGRVRRGFQGELGDLALNLTYTRRKLGRFAPSLHGEVAFLVLHGILHLCGRHHDNPEQEKSMWQLSHKLFPPPPALLRRLTLSV